MEILNLDYNIGRLVIKALNLTTKRKDANELLGISERVLYNKIKEYGIIQRIEDGIMTYTSDDPRLKKETYLEQTNNEKDSNHHPSLRMQYETTATNTDTWQG